MAKAPPVLDLGTLKPRPKVKIDGKWYEMRTRDEVIYSMQREQRKFHRLGQLMQKRNATDREQTEQSRLLDVFTRKLLIAPNVIHARLSDMDRAKILMFFSAGMKAKG